MTNLKGQDDLSAEARQMFASLPRHRTPPLSLEENIMDELKERGLIEGKKPASWLRFPQLAAALVILAIGLGIGYGVGNKQPQAANNEHANPLFVLLLHEPSARHAGEAELVGEYKRWAMGVHKTGRYISGEKLRESGKVLHQENGDLKIAEGVLNTGTELGGYFIIEAKDYDEALKIASECPHLKHGGKIELREIEPT